MLSYKRSTRVAELVQQEVSKIVQEIKEPGLGFITITGVKMTDDLQFARIFYSVIGSEEELAKSHAYLQSAIPGIRHELAIRVNLRRTPEIVFEFDTSPARAERIHSILERLHREEQEHPRPETPAPEPEPEPKKHAEKSKKGKP